MRIKTMQNVSTAKSSKASEALGIFEPPISCLQDKRTNQYATEPCNRELSSTSLPDSYGQKTKRANDDKVYAECTESKIFKDKRPLGGFEPPISCLQDKRITTRLERRNKERKQK